MPKVAIYNINHENVGEVDLPDFIYASTITPHLVQEVVRAQLNKKRAGSASTKTRALVAYANRKPYRQKKTGRARLGSRKSPLLRGGGTIFGPHPRDFGFKPPAQIRRKALRSVLTSKLENNKLDVLDYFPISAIRTKKVVESLAPWEIKTSLIVIPKVDVILEKSARNIPTVKVLRVEGLNCYDILHHDNIIILKDSLPMIEERLGKK